MVDFSKLMKKPAGEAKKPPALVAGQYPGVIKGFEPKEAPPGKEYDTFIRFHLGLTDWPESVEQEDRVQDDGNGGTKPIDLSKRQLRKDFYDNSLHRLDEFIRSCGIDPKGRSYEEVLPELTGKTVLVDVAQYMNQQTTEIGNNVNNVIGEAG